ncbi:MAG: NuoM family protein [Cyclobacteriaceae bacterium]
MMLSLLLLLPLVLVLLFLVVPKHYESSFKWITLAVTGIQLVMACFMLASYNKELSGSIIKESSFQFVEHVQWISLNLGSLGKLQIDYFLGVDGLNVLMVFLSTIVLFIGTISSWNISKNAKGYFILFALLNTAIIGCFVALDFFLFYLFFEFMLLPMYFLIGIWGGVRREYASLKFFLFTLLGSIFILVVMIGLYNSVIDPVATAIQMGLVDSPLLISDSQIAVVQLAVRQGTIPSNQLVHTFNLLAMGDSNNFIPGSIFYKGNDLLMMGLAPRAWAFLALFIGFAIKLPLVPLHTWLPDAHVEAPTPISVVLAGILLKVGAYGLIRVAYTIFADASMDFAWTAGLLGVISIVYGAYNALAQQDLKKMIAYSSVSHMGFVMLGIASVTAEGVTGAMYQLFSHGIISSMLFICVGVIYERTGNRQIDSYSGLVSKMPAYTALTMIAFFASLGLPGFSGFISELLVFLGSFNSASVNQLIPRWMPLVSLIGIIIGAGYYLWTLQRMFFGEFWLKKPSEWTDFIKDLTQREYVMLIPLGLAAFVLGIFPNLLISFIEASINQFVIFVN